MSNACQVNRLSPVDFYGKLGDKNVFEATSFTTINISYLLSCNTAYWVRDFDFSGEYVELKKSEWNLAKLHPKNHFACKE
jgi:hypothetical protein